MGLRQSLNDNPVITTTVTILIILGATAVLIRQGCDFSSRSDGPSGMQYVTTDDGQSWFAAADYLVPPFQHEGKTAYRVKVYRCPDGSEFVSHLERFAEPDRKRMQDAIDKARAADGDVRPAEALFPQAMEIKRPGEKDWIRWSTATSEAYNAIMTPKCPDGATQGIQLVQPG